MYGHEELRYNLPQHRDVAQLRMAKNRNPAPCRDDQRIFPGELRGADRTLRRLAIPGQRIKPKFLEAGIIDLDLSRGRVETIYFIFFEGIRNGDATLLLQLLVRDTR